MNLQVRLYFTIPIESEDLDATLAVVSHGFEVKLETGRKIERREKERGRDAAIRTPREERKPAERRRRPSFPFVRRLSASAKTQCSIPQNLSPCNPRRFYESKIERSKMKIKSRKELQRKLRSTIPHNSLQINFPACHW